LNALFPAAPHNFARVSSKPGHTRTLNGYTVPTRKYTIIDLPGYGFRGREEWEQEVWELLRSRRQYIFISTGFNCSLRKAYVLIDALHGPKEKDIDILEQLAKTGLPHQLVLSKLDRALPTLWNEIGVTLRHNPVLGSSFVSAVRKPLSSTVSSKSLQELQMGVWTPLRGKLGLGCDDTILGVSSEEGWGISALRCSMIQACGLFKGSNLGDDKYLEALQQVPIIKDHAESTAKELNEEEKPVERPPKGGRQKVTFETPRYKDDNPMRGKVFGGKEMLRKRIYRW
jgi:GTP-binding protein